MSRYAPRRYADQTDEARMYRYVFWIKSRKASNVMYTVIALRFYTKKMLNFLKNKYLDIYLSIFGQASWHLLYTLVHFLSSDSYTNT